MPATLSARLKSIENEKNKSKKPSIGKEFSFSDFILLDNKFYLIAEKNFTQVITNTSTDKRGFVGPSSSYKVHNSFGMIVFELNKEGNINWYNYIPKLQSYIV